MRNLLLSFALLSIFSSVSADETDGSKLYSNRCALCHGSTGKGDGAASKAMQPKPSDLTKAFTRDELKSAISNGKEGTPMRSFKLDQTKLDALLDYLISIQGTE